MTSDACFCNCFIPLREKEPELCEARVFLKTNSVFLISHPEAGNKAMEWQVLGFKQ